MCKFLSSLKVVNPKTQLDVTQNLKCLDGFQITINAILFLWKELHEKESLKFLLTRRLNQDPLENFFGAIRQQGGNVDNPTPLQFTRAFRKLFYDNFLAPTNGNCFQDFDVVLVGTDFPTAHLTTYSKSSPGSQQPQVPFDFDVADYNLVPIESNVTGINAITYVAGYLLKKCLLKHQCSVCKDHLTTDELNDESQLFCWFKAYPSSNKPFGGLLCPSSFFVSYICKLEDKFVAEFSKRFHKPGIGNSLLQHLEKFTFTECKEFPSVYLLKIFIRMRIHYMLKFGNRELKSENRKNRKYFKVTHL